DPSGLSQAGNPLKNLYSGLGNTGPSYSAQQLFGGPINIGDSFATTSTPSLSPIASQIASAGLGYSDIGQTMWRFIGEYQFTGREFLERHRGSLRASGCSVVLKRGLGA